MLDLVQVHLDFEIWVLRVKGIIIFVTLHYSWLLRRLLILTILDRFWGQWTSGYIFVTIWYQNRSIINDSSYNWIELERLAWKQFSDYSNYNVDCWRRLETQMASVATETAALLMRGRTDDVMSFSHQFWRLSTDLVPAIFIYISCFLPFVICPVYRSLLC